MNIFRNLLYMARRFKTATVLNFVGLTVAFVACYLFLTQVTYNHSYNKELTDSERLYRLEVQGIFAEGQWGSHICRVLAEQMVTFPQVESVSFVQCWINQWRYQNDETEFIFNRRCVNDDGIKTLAPRLLDGRLAWKEGETDGVIIPASIAMQYFGATQVAGRCMRSMNDSVQVIGVFEDFPENSVATNCVYANIADENKGVFNNWNYNCYVKLRESVDTTGINTLVSKAITKKVDEWIKEQGGPGLTENDGQNGSLVVRLVPFADTWFSGIDPNFDKGNATVDWILQLSCILVILIAAINFLNFTLAESPMRIKSINTRRVLGSSTSMLRLSFVGETVLTAIVSFVLGLAVIYLLSQWPFIHDLLAGSIQLADHPLLLLALAFVAVVVGIFAGVYPAYYVTSFQPALVLKGSFGLTPKGRSLRTSLLCLQFVITSVMVVYIGILYLQSHYIFHSDYGYAKDEVLQAYTWDVFDKRDAVRTEVSQLTGVKDVSYSQFILGSGDQYMGWGRADKNHRINLTCMPVDWRYLRTMGIEVIEGRDFTEYDGDVYIINEAARKQWNWVEMNKPLLDDDLTVVGVCRNIRFNSTRVDNSNAPMAFAILGEKYQNWDNRAVLNVRVAAGIDKLAMRQKIKDILVKFGANNGVEVKFLDQRLENTYQEEFRFIRQVLVFSVICLIITLIGVFCMTMFETEYRRKEIGIRKVMGSSTSEILSMLSRRYLWLLLGSFIVAMPLAWYVGTQWLQGFAEHTPIYWWLFPLSLLVVSLITLATVIIQSWRTANENPVNSIKNE